MRAAKLGIGILLFILSSFSSSGQSEEAAKAWTGTWAAAPSAMVNRGVGSRAQTIREIVHVSTAGSLVRVKVSNELGIGPLRVGRASIALGENEDRLKGTPVPLTFNGKDAIAVPAGKSVVSDPAQLQVPALSDVAVSLFIPPQEIKIVTVHWFADATNFVAPNDQAMALVLDRPVKYFQWPILTSLEVKAQEDKNAAGIGQVEGSRKPRGAIVCLGDSITAGFHSTLDANDRWTNVLANRLQANERLSGLGVLNEGIPSNRVLIGGRGKAGPSALARFHSDVLEQAGAKYLIISEGINDIGGGYGPQNPDHTNAPSAQDLESAYRKMAAEAHAHGIEVIGATITPYRGAHYYSETGEAVRQKVNT